MKILHFQTLKHESNICSLNPKLITEQTQCIALVPIAQPTLLKIITQYTEFLIVQNTANLLLGMTINKCMKLNVDIFKAGNVLYITYNEPQQSQQSLI